MWPGGYADWIVLGSGYALALGLFYWLGGIGRAGEAIGNWGRSSTRGASLALADHKRKEER